MRRHIVHTSQDVYTSELAAQHEASQSHSTHSPRPHDPALIEQSIGGGVTGARALFSAQTSRAPDAAALAQNAESHAERIARIRAEIDALQQDVGPSPQVSDLVSDLAKAIVSISSSSSSSSSTTSSAGSKSSSSFSSKANDGNGNSLPTVLALEERVSRLEALMPSSQLNSADASDALLVSPVEVVVARLRSLKGVHETMGDLVTRIETARAKAEEVDRKLQVQSVLLGTLEQAVADMHDQHVQ
jgi:hypothetical protein